MHPDIVPNKYYTTYQSLIEKRIHLIPPSDVYTETHHILPKCMGGSNKKNNLVVLTAKEHYIAHHLLFLCTKGNSHYKMAFAWNMMSVNNTTHCRYSNARLYAKAKEAAACAISKINTGRRGLTGRNCYRYDHTIYTWYHIPTDSFWACTQHELYTQVEPLLTSAELYQLKKHPTHSHKGWMLAPNAPNRPKLYKNSGANSPSADRTKYHFYHPDKGFVYLTRHELAQQFPQYKITATGISDIITGRQNWHRGWCIAKTLEDVPPAKPSKERTIDHTIFHFEHPVEGTFECTRIELVKMFPLQNISSSALKRVASGDIAHHKQWKVSYL